MNRMHIHVGVEKLDESIKFYSTLFGTEPTKTKPDYAKWVLDDPRINFAISTRVKNGLDHLGLQADDETELAALRERLKSADVALFDEGDTVCCYARSDKSWVTDPDGIAWEAFRTMEDAELHAEARRMASCCAREAKSQPGNYAPGGKATGCCS